MTRRAPLFCLPFGVRLELAEQQATDERWVQVVLVDGSRAWVQQGDLNIRLEPVSIGEVIATGKRFLGLPYRWGGTTTFGFDCSGLTQLLCSLRGVLIPRDSGPQSRWDGMVDVERSQLEPGDLLFFGPSPDKVTHTGMYIGEGRFLHATTHGRPVVQISDLSDPHWSQLLVR
ncbi:MAG: C40 family peptidase, partial [Thermoleophilia bacterium]|nr:C40 family peptidase [Thermoleophilia bacterium]